MPSVLAALKWLDSDRGYYGIFKYTFFTLLLSGLRKADPGDPDQPMSGWVTSNLQFAFNNNLKLRCNTEYTLFYPLLQLPFQSPSSFLVIEVRPAYDTGACPAHLFCPWWQPSTCIPLGSQHCAAGVQIDLCLPLLSHDLSKGTDSRLWVTVQAVACNLAEIRGDSYWNTEIRIAVRSFWFIKNMSRASERRRIRQMKRSKWMDSKHTKDTLKYLGVLIQCMKPQRPCSPGKKQCNQMDISILEILLMHKRLINYSLRL